MAVNKQIINLDKVNDDSCDEEVSDQYKLQRVKQEIIRMQTQINKLLDEINQNNKKSDEQNIIIKNEREIATGAEKQIKMTIDIQENILNVYLLLKYRAFDEGSVPDKRYHQNLIKTFGAITYVTMFSQGGSITLLCRVFTMTTNTGVFFEEFNNHKPEGETYSYFMFPFLLYGMLMAWKEAQASRTDFNAMKQHLKGAVPVEMFCLKTIELLLGYVGSCIYFSILCVYSDIRAWENILDAILNLLAFQFVLEADEWAYAVFAKMKALAFMAKLNDNLADKNEEEIDLFQMTMYTSERQWVIGSSLWRAGSQTLLIFCLCCFLQWLLSNPSSNPFSHV